MALSLPFPSFLPMFLFLTYNHLPFTINGYRYDNCKIPLCKPISSLKKSRQGRNLNSPTLSQLGLRKNRIQIRYPLYRCCFPSFLLIFVYELYEPVVFYRTSVRLEKEWFLSNGGECDYHDVGKGVNNRLRIFKISKQSKQLQIDIYFF